MGTDNTDLPATLKILTPSKETNSRKKEHEDSWESDEENSKNFPEEINTYYALTRMN